MKYKLLGKSGLKVSELALGAMTFGTEMGFGVDKDESRKVYEAFREEGGNFIDTANLEINKMKELNNGFYHMSKFLRYHNE